MRRNSILLLKWLIFLGICMIGFQSICDGLVNIFLSIPIGRDTKDNNFYASYEEFLINWATTGQRLTNEKFSMDKIQPRDDLQLIGAQVVFRHGARTPLHLLPSLEQVIYSKEQIDNYLPSKWEIKLILKKENEIVSREKISSANDIAGNRFDQLKSTSEERVITGQLTSIGEKQLFQLGRLLRSELIDENHGLLPATYDPKYVFCRSTYMDRTISSARSFLAGLFTSDNKIQANGPFEIEVHHFPDEDMFPNPNLYPILNKCHSAPSLYTSLNDDHELKKARQTLLNHIGATEYQYGIIELHDDIISRLAHNFTVPKDILELSKDFDVMSGREYVYRATNIGFDSFIRASCGSFLNLIRENFNSLLKNHLDNPNKSYQKLFIYSGHDTTLIPLAMAFEIFDMRWPKYATYIFLKYFISKTNPNETYVTVNYGGEPQILPNCEDYYCPYSTLLMNLQNRFDQPKR
jgi:hypothetical protein